MFLVEVIHQEMRLNERIQIRRDTEGLYRISACGIQFCTTHADNPYLTIDTQGVRSENMFSAVNQILRVFETGCFLRGRQSQSWTICSEKGGSLGL